MLLFNHPVSSLLVKVSSTAGLALALVACGGSSGGSGGGSTPISGGPSLPGGGSSSPETINYTGPAPRNDDVQNFRSALWSELALTSRCGGCHIQGGAGTPAFMDTADINNAYDITLGSTSFGPLVDLSNPSASRLVSKVTEGSEGHNCWLSNDQVCANLIVGWIQNWAGAGGSSSSFLGALNLSDPTLRDVGESKQFPAEADNSPGVDFQSTVYTLLNPHCGSCHAGDSALQQQPFIGGISANTTIADPDDALEDLNVSYEAARSRINLESPELSRLVTRLQEGHNCWSGDCQADAISMRTQIEAFSNGIAPTVVNAQLVTSRALSLADGLAASTGGRVENNLIAKWTFGAGSGSTAFDVSGVDPALDLNIIGNVEWTASGGVRINDGKLQGTTTNSAKLYDRITASGEYSIEGWFVPLNVTQDGPARIVTYSGAVDRRNFMLGQTLYSYNFLARSSAEGIDSDGNPALSTVNDDEVLQATLQHVVVTYSAVDGRKIYVNGELVVENDPQGAGNFNSWDRNFAFAVGDEVSNDQQWQGSVRLLAVYDREMPLVDIQTNYEIGVGQKFYLLFSVAEHVNIPRSYIVMQVEQFDDYGYLFNEPFFVSLDASATILDFPLEGMRIGINGQEAAVGQAYANLDATITAAAVNEGEGRQVLSSVGTIIGVDQGSSIDEFFLTFERLGSSENVFVEGTPSPQEPIPSNEEQSDIGIKTFDEINEALSALTGISKTNIGVVSTFDAVRQQMPIDADIDGFLPAHQLAITQLAVSYCNELVQQESSAGAVGYFSGFNFNGNVASAFTAAGRSQVITPLLDNLLANGSGDQPAFATAETELDGLITDLIDSCDNPPQGESCTQNSDRTRSMVTAVCSAAYGSGMMLIQ